MVKKGIAIMEVNDAGSKAVFINDDALHMARLNAMIKQRKEDTEAEIAKIEHEKRMIEKQKKRWKDYTINTFSCIGVCLAIIGGSIWAMTIEMMHPIIAIPVSVICLVTSSVRFGVWFGNSTRH